MKFAEPKPYADPEVAMRKLLEIASTVEPVQDGRIHIGARSEVAGALAGDMRAGPTSQVPLHPRPARIAANDVLGGKLGA